MLLLAACFRLPRAFSWPDSIKKAESIFPFCYPSPQGFGLHVSLCKRTSLGGQIRQALPPLPGRVIIAVGVALFNKLNSK